MNTFKKFIGPLLFGTLFGFSMLGRITPMSLERQAPDTIQAEIKGAVLEPGVYTLKNGAQLQDLINAAQGVNEMADLSPFSLQQEVQPGQIIVIGQKKADGTSPCISLNTASKEQLLTLPGVGESTAQKILDYRQNHSFQSLEQLMEVPGIGEKKFEKLKPYLAL